MEKLRKIGSLVLGLVMTSGMVYGKATTGVAIFNHSVGTRQLGMADAAVGLADDVNAIFYNPAGLAQVRKLELNAMYFNNIVDTKDEAVSIVTPLRRGIFGGTASVGIGIRAYQGGDIEVIMLDSNNNEIKHETLSAENDYMVGIGYSEKIGKNLYLGLALKGIHSTLVEDYTASAVALDAGALYHTSVEGLSVGLSLLNNGTEMKFIDEGDALPMRTIIGAGYKIRPLSNVGVKVGLDYMKEKNADGRTSIGAELTLLDMISVRSGYYVDSDLGSITAGIGIKLGSIQIDYGYAMMDELGDLHRASLTMRWDTRKEEVTQKKTSKKQIARKKKATKTKKFIKRRRTVKKYSLGK